MSWSRSTSERESSFVSTRQIVTIWITEQFEQPADSSLEDDDDRHWSIFSEGKKTTTNSCGLALKILKSKLSPKEICSSSSSLSIRNVLFWTMLMYLWHVANIYRGMTSRNGYVIARVFRFSSLAIYLCTVWLHLISSITRGSTEREILFFPLLSRKKEKKNSEVSTVKICWRDSRQVKSLIVYLRHNQSESRVFVCLIKKECEFVFAEIDVSDVLNRCEEKKKKTK